MIDYIKDTTEDIAKKLLGTTIIFTTENSVLSGYIVETEAYLGTIDAASHSYNMRKTPRLMSLYKEGGHSYVYVMHTHAMFNIVTKEEGNPQAVLIRAIQPLEGIDIMHKNRKSYDENVSNGPGKFTKALGLSTLHDGLLLNTETIIIDESHKKTPQQIVISPRIGIPNKGIWTDSPLRFYVLGNPYVSNITKKSIDSVSLGWK